MEPRNDANGVDEITGTTARWFVENAIGISRAEFERLMGNRKGRAASDANALEPTDQTKSPQPQVGHDFASIAPSQMDANEDEVPTLMWNPSHLSVTSKHIASRKNESAANVVARSSSSQGNETKTRSAVRPKTTPTLPQAIVKKTPQPTIQNANPPAWPLTPPAQQSPQFSAPDKTKQPIMQSASHLTHFEREQPLPVPAAQRHSVRAPSAAKRARAVPPPIPPMSKRRAAVDAPRPRIQPSARRLAVEARPRLATRFIKEPAIRTARSRTWVWNTVSTAALFVLVLTGRFLIANSPVTSTKATEPVARSEVRSDAVGVKVEAVRSSAPSAATAVPTSNATPVVNEPSPVRPASAYRAIQRVQLKNKSIPRRTIATPTARRAAERPSVASGASTLRVNSRPWSQVFVDGNLVGNTPQMGLALKAGRHTVKLVNASMGISKTIKVNLEPGQTLTKVVNLIE
jgi:hypothetical protein